MGQVAGSFDWELRLTLVESNRTRVDYERLTGNTSRHQAAADADVIANIDVNKRQLAAYCEAVKRLTAQGIDTCHAIQVLKQCGGDLDAAELWMGVCSSVGLYSVTGESETAEPSWAWEDERGSLQIADSLQEVVQGMKRSDTGALTYVAGVIETTCMAVTPEMVQEVAQLERARQQAEQPHSDGLSVEQIQARLASSNLKVVAIEEVLNPALWKLYTQQKQSMAEASEQWLFHGSGPENIANISVEGFDLKLASLHGSCGAGIYFAESSLTSQGFTRKDALKGCSPQICRSQCQPELLSKARVMGLHVMLLCSVLVGRVGQAQGRQTQAPTGFDSTGNSSMSVVYKSAQAYPRYMLFLKS